MEEAGVSETPNCAASTKRKVNNVLFFEGTVDDFVLEQEAFDSNVRESSSRDIKLVVS